MATPNRYVVYLGGALIGASWSLHSANEKLTAAVLVRAHERGLFPVEGYILNPRGDRIATREFPGFFDQEGAYHGE